MEQFTETVNISVGDDGYISIDLHRVDDVGIEYRSVLYFQASDAAALADALERFASTQAEESVTLADGTVRLFTQYRSEMINVELERTDGVPHGGYDTMDFGPGSVKAIVDGLRQHSP